MSNNNSHYYTKSIIYLLNRYVLNKKSMIGCSKKYDLMFKFKTPDSVGRTIFKNGLYEEDLTNYLLNNLNLKEGDVIFDVGANIGWYSNLLSKYFKGVEIHSFEPDPENFEILVSNLERNKSENVFPNNCGIGEKRDILKLYLYKRGNQGRHSMLNINNGSSIEVKIISFDEYIKEKYIDISRIKFLKIDIEGYEYFAFLGGKEFLKHVPMILAEFSPGYMRKAGLEPEKLLKLLRSFNYIPFVVKETSLQTVEDHELLSEDFNVNLIWKKV